MNPQPSGPVAEWFPSSVTYNELGPYDAEVLGHRHDGMVLPRFTAQVMRQIAVEAASYPPAALDTWTIAFADHGHRMALLAVYRTPDENAAAYDALYNAPYAGGLSSYEITQTRGPRLLPRPRSPQAPADSADACRAL